MKTFKTIAKLYKEGKLTKELRSQYKKEIEEQILLQQQTRYRTKNGTTIDLIALKESVKGKQGVLPLITRHWPNKRDEWQRKLPT